MLAAPFLNRQAKGDVAQDRHVAEQGVILEDEADIAPAHGHGADLGAADKKAAAFGRLQPRDQAQDGGLAAPAGAEQGRQFAFVDGEADVAQGDDLAVALGDVF